MQATCDVYAYDAYEPRGMIWARAPKSSRILVNNTGPQPLKHHDTSIGRVASASRQECRFCHACNFLLQYVICVAKTANVQILPGHACLPDRSGLEAWSEGAASKTVPGEVAQAMQAAPLLCGPDEHKVCKKAPLLAMLTICV